MIKKVYVLLISVAFCLLLIFPSAIYGQSIGSDIFKNHRCGTPYYHDQTVELAKQNIRRSLSAEEMISKGYLNADGTKMVKTVGNVELFWVIDDKVWVQIEAELVKINEFAYVYVQTEDRKGDKVLYDSTTGEGYITQGDANTIAREFYRTTDSNNIYETDRLTFGVEPPTGVNGDPRVTILLLDIDSDYADYTENNELWWSFSWTGGYFYAGDTYPETDVAPSYHSNERKIIYIDTYPSIEHGHIDYNTNTVYPTPTINHGDDINSSGAFMEGPEAASPTLAHEFQHMINYYHDNYEDIWVNEGCSGLAEYVNGFGHPFSVEDFVQNPTTSLITWNSTLANYGNSYLFILYLYEHFGNVPAIQNLINEQAIGITGVENMTQAMGQPTAFKNLLINWLIANYFDSDYMDFKYRYDLINMSDYGKGDIRDGINPIISSTIGFGFVNSMAAEYSEVSYSGFNYLTYTGSSFTPVVVKISDLSVIGIDQNIPLAENYLLSDFGTLYSKIILISANTSSNNEGSYSFSLNNGDDTDDTIKSKNRTFFCFVASASYLDNDKPSFADKLLDFLRKLVQ